MTLLDPIPFYKFYNVLCFLFIKEPKYSIDFFLSNLFQNMHKKGEFLLTNIHFFLSLDYFITITHQYLEWENNLLKLLVLYSLFHEQFRAMHVTLLLGNYPWKIGWVVNSLQLQNHRNSKGASTLTFVQNVWFTRS